MTKSLYTLNIPTDFVSMAQKLFHKGTFPPLPYVLVILAEVSLDPAHSQTRPSPTVPTSHHGPHSDRASDLTQQPDPGSPSRGATHPPSQTSCLPQYTQPHTLPLKPHVSLNTHSHTPSLPLKPHVSLNTHSHTPSLSNLTSPSIHTATHPPSQTSRLPQYTQPHTLPLKPHVSLNTHSHISSLSNLMSPSIHTATHPPSQTSCLPQYTHPPSQTSCLPQYTQPHILPLKPHVSLNTHSHTSSLSNLMSPSIHTATHPPSQTSCLPQYTESSRCPSLPGRILLLQPSLTVNLFFEFRFAPIRAVLLTSAGNKRKTNSFRSLIYPNLIQTVFTLYFFPLFLAPVTILFSARNLSSPPPPPPPPIYLPFCLI